MSNLKTLITLLSILAVVVLLVAYLRAYLKSGDPDQWRAECEIQGGTFKQRSDASYACETLPVGANAPALTVPR